MIPKNIIYFNYNKSWGDVKNFGGFFLVIFDKFSNENTALRTKSTKHGNLINLSLFYSYLSASIGFSLAAFFAGRYPNTTPIAAEAPNASAIELSVGVTESSKPNR